MPMNKAKDLQALSAIFKAQAHPSSPATGVPFSSTRLIDQNSSGFTDFQIHLLPLKLMEDSCLNPRDGFANLCYCA